VTRLQKSAPALFGALLFAAFFLSLFDPAVQLYYRDTGRLYYAVKLYIAQQLHAGYFPLWDRMTECGVSLLGQLTPGLLHPATLLYLIFPFDVAFKLNHILGSALAGVGAFRLARRLGASSWAALCAAVAYGGCGYLISVTGSNLPYALGAGSVPLAIDGVLGFVEKPGALRLAWAGAAVALIALAGEPQSMLIAGMIAGAWAALSGSSVKGAVRNLGLTACCGALALCLAAPAIGPAVTELRRSNRDLPLSLAERQVFANSPSRLLGLLVPRAFDDAVEAQERSEPLTPYYEYFATGTTAFADTIVLGAPALLFAAAALWTGRRGKLLVAGAALFALSSAGDALGIDRVVFGAVPLARIFRYTEKLSAPASLLFALAAALGADLTLAGSRRAARTLFVAALGLACLCGAAYLIVGWRLDALAAALVPWGRSHTPRMAYGFLGQLRAGLLDTGGLSLAVATVAALRWVRGREVLPLGSVCCAAAVFASCGGLLYTAPVRFLRGPFDLAEKFVSRAGPSPGRWRLFVNEGIPAILGGLDTRFTTTASIAEALKPQFDSVANIEGMAAYFSASDPDYVAPIQAVPERYFDLFGVRFAVEMPDQFNERTAAERGFRRMGLGYWVREYPVRPRAFVVGIARRAASGAEAMALVTTPGVDFRREAVIRGDEAPTRVRGAAGPARLERGSPERMRIRATGPGLLVVAEHFDPGWRASIDGADAPVLETDLAALGVVLPDRAVTVDLRFEPRGFRAGLWLALVAAAALAAAAVRAKMMTKSVTPPTIGV